jgi:D-beta-D-heptose 7-phosphate kinase/D-beta-D-heptose 1-phosphate adenosyltransferase
MKIFVIGDVMIDINQYVETIRNAPEKACLPIYKIQNTEYILGGASNVANNLSYFEDCSVELISIIGKDANGEKIKTLLNERQIRYYLLESKNRKTTSKTRQFCNNVLVNRLDDEYIIDINKIEEEYLCDYITENLHGLDAIIISDYNKGLCSPHFCKRIINICNKNNILTFVDPKINNVLKYKNAFCFKPNLQEAREITGEHNINAIFKKIDEMMKCSQLIITASEKGIYYREHLENIPNYNINNESFLQNIRSPGSIQPIDVTGAGDIVIVVYVYFYVKTRNIEFSLKIAESIARKSILKIGNYIINYNDILGSQLEQKKVVQEDEIEKIEYIRTHYDNIVFTNGCFDILHSAHIKLLRFAKKQGSILIVGLNTDESIKENKGSNRPINNLQERMEILKEFDFIDYIIPFKDKTPYILLEKLRPDIIVKGGDYKKDDIVGSEFVKEVVLFDYIDGKSSTNVITNILTRS